MRQTRKTQKPTENDRRAGNAQDALIVFARRTGLSINTDGMETVVVDFLADLRHLCDSHGLDLGELDRKAHNHYLAELEDARGTLHYTRGIGTGAVHVRVLPALS